MREGDPRGWLISWWSLDVPEPSGRVHCAPAHFCTGALPFLVRVLTAFLVRVLTGSPARFGHRDGGGPPPTAARVAEPRRAQ